MRLISQSNPNIHKGPSKSADFNKLQRDLHYDLSTLFNIANEHDIQIKENMDNLIRENFFLQNKINELSAFVEQIKADLTYREQGLSKQQIVKSMYTLNHVLETGSEIYANIDTLYGAAMIQDSDRISKLSYQSDENEVIIPRSLEVSLLESTSISPINEVTGMREYYEVKDSKLLNAFDRNNNTFWVRSSQFEDESNVSEVYGILHIRLPLDILNNIYSNILTLHPYPEHALTIADIQYKGYGDTWYRLPNYPTERDQMGIERPVKIKEAGKLLFSFPKTEITEIQIFFQQPYWFLNEGKRDFVYGFQDINVEYRNYNSPVAEFVTEFNIEDTGKAFHIIDQPIAVPANGSEQNIEDLIEHKLYYSQSLTDEFEFGSEILAPIQKIYIKTILRSEGDIVPVIKNLKLNYTYKDLSGL